MISQQHISDRALNIPTSAIHEMTRLSQLQEDVAFLSWAKPTSDTPEHIKEAASKAIMEGKTAGYSPTWGLMQLREAIAEKLRDDNKIAAKPDEVMITVGAIEGLSAAVLATVNPGDEVIIPIPGYSTHVRQVEIAGGKPVLVETDEENGFKLDIEKIKASVTERTKAIIFSDPNNPTGAVYAKGELQALADIAKTNDLIIIVDEAYEYFTYDDHKHYSIASFEGMHDRVISVFTFTKSYAMTGWRVGYLHAHADLIKHIVKMHIPLAICAPVVAQYAAIGALEGPQDCIAEYRQHYLTVRNLMCDRLDSVKHIFDYQKPKGAYLMFPRIKMEGKDDSMTFAVNLLQKAGVSTTPGIAFKGEGHVRMSFCVPEEMVNKAFDRIENYVGTSS
jgi:aminotransferase